ncbi:hypothetical protein HanPI659440_Chr05g0195711 [Helianthus annuus]|nr:hypothetical protein HanPI659440_Chr05g0195711 [Helianthus annuus]
MVRVSGQPIQEVRFRLVQIRLLFMVVQDNLVMFGFHFGFGPRSDFCADSCRVRFKYDSGYV